MSTEVVPECFDCESSRLVWIPGLGEEHRLGADYAYYRLLDYVKLEMKKMGRECALCEYGTASIDFENDTSLPAELAIRPTAEFIQVIGRIVIRCTSDVLTLTDYDCASSSDQGKSTSAHLYRDTDEVLETIDELISGMTISNNGNVPIGNQRKNELTGRIHYEPLDDSEETVFDISFVDPNIVMGVIGIVIEEIQRVVRESTDDEPGTSDMPVNARKVDRLNIVGDVIEQLFVDLQLSVNERDHEPYRIESKE